MENKFKCPVCGYPTLSEERMFDVCSVCGWEDDALQFTKPDMGGGANFLSLNKFRELFLSGQNAKSIDRKLHEDFLNSKNKKHGGK